MNRRDNRIAGILQILIPRSFIADQHCNGVAKREGGGKGSLNRFYLSCSFFIVNRPLDDSLSPVSKDPPSLTRRIHNGPDSQVYLKIPGINTMAERHQYSKNPVFPGVHVRVCMNDRNQARWASTVSSWLPCCSAWSITSVTLFSFPVAFTCIPPWSVHGGEPVTFTPIVSREIWVVTPWKTWQYFQVPDDRIVEVRCDGQPVLQGEKVHGKG